MKEVGYNQISLVLETWDAARFLDKEFENTFGFKAVQKYVNKVEQTTLKYVTYSSLTMALFPPIQNV